MKTFSFTTLDDRQRNSKVLEALEECGAGNEELKTALRTQNKFGENGFISIAIEEAKLVGIAGCEINQTAYPNAVQVGMGIWTSPHHDDRPVVRELLRPQIQMAQSISRKAWMLDCPEAKRPEVVTLWSCQDHLVDGTIIHRRDVQHG